MFVLIKSDTGNRNLSLLWIRELSLALNLPENLLDETKSW
jgi:hypothetical protein